MNKYFLCIILFYNSLPSIFSNNILIQDLYLQTAYNGQQKLYIVDHHYDKNYGYFLVINKKSYKTTNKEHITVIDMLEAPFYKKVSPDRIVEYQVACNKMITEEKTYSTLMAVFFPMFFLTGGPAAGFIYLTYYLFDFTVHYGIAAFVYTIGGCFTLILGAGFGIFSIASLVIAIVALVKSKTTVPANRQHLNELKNSIINQLNNTQYPRYDSYNNGYQKDIISYNIQLK